MKYEPIALPSKRLAKEANYYEQEVKENEAILQQMKDDNKDPYDIKKFQEVLGESHMMIPDSISRRDKTLDDLKEFVALSRKEEFEDGKNSDLMGCGWMVEASSILGEDEGSGGSKREGGQNGGGGDGDVAVTVVDGLAGGEAF